MSEGASLECGCYICPAHAAEILEGRLTLHRKINDLQQEIITLRTAMQEPYEDVVYFVRRSDGLVKIGTTYQLVKRFRDLQRQHGSLALLGFESGDQTRERELHQMFAEFRREGEWFVREGELDQYLVILQRKRPMAKLLETSADHSDRAPAPLAFRGDAPPFKAPNAK